MMKNTYVRRMGNRIVASHAACFAIAYLFLVVGLLIPVKSSATHAAGADIAYEWVSGNTYKVTCTFYRDCGGVAAPNTVTLRVRSTQLNVSFIQTLQRLNPTGQEITFSCTGITNCSGGTQTGIQRYVYQGNVTLPGPATDWKFSYQVCCRNCSITTILLPQPCDNNISEPQIYVEATLNSVVALQNSSPTFTVNPVLFICQGQLFNFNQGALDIDGDSLNYELIIPKTSTTTSVTYIPPFNTTNFISSAPAPSLNPTTGQIALTPTTTGQVGIIALLVKEFRNGVLIGSTIRDVQIQIVDCSNQNPVISGVDGSSSYEVEVCAGEEINFQLTATDPDAGQLLTLTWNNGIPAPATFTTSGISNPVTGTFNWQTTPADGSTIPYSFVVTVQDNGCFFNNIQSFAYTIFVRNVTATISTDNVSCLGANDASATANPTGSGPFTYKWSNNATTQTISGLQPGTYSVTVTGALGCTTVSSVTITEPTLLTLNATVENNVQCSGGNDGSATALGSGGTAPYSYQWSSGATTSTVTGLAQGTYTVTVTDNNQCSATSSVTITESTPVDITVTSNQPAGCLGESSGAVDIIVSGGQAPYTFQWSNGATTEDINLLPAGTYNVTVTDNVGCTGTQIAVIDQPSIPVPLITAVSVNGINVSCFGAATGQASVSVTGGTPPYSFIWSNGSTESSVSGLSAGLVSVIVSDQNGCSNLDTLEITQPPLPFTLEFDSISNYNGTGVSCSGINDGFIVTSTTGGQSPFTYLWSGAQTTSAISGLAPGSYSVTATDALGCTTSNTAIITPAEPLNLSLLPADTVGFNINCFGEASGVVSVVFSGGTSPYTFNWNNGATTPFISNLTAGTYSLTLTDINGCSATESITLTQSDSIVPLINSPVITGGTNLLCFGDSDASASVTVTGGTPPYNYLWSNGATADNVNNLSAGVVSVTIQDVNTCSANASLTISQPEAIGITLSADPLINCGNANDGGINAVITGGTGAYNYSWSNSSSTQNLSGLSAGTYTLTVTDENNCSSENAITLTAPPTLVSISDVTPPSCSNSTDAFITLNTSGGTPEYTYSWSNGATSSSLSGIGAGTYTVTITDELGCTLVLNIPVEGPLPLDLTPIVTDVSCFGFFDGIINVNPSGGIPPYSFIWSNGSTNQINTSLSAGSYSVTVTDANNCTAVSNKVCNQPTIISADIVVTPQSYCQSTPNGSINLSVSGGTAPYTFLWFNESTTEDIDPITNGTYFVTITDANNCAEIIENIIVPETDTLNINSEITQPNCNSSPDGLITLIVTGGSTPYTYLWSDGSSFSSLTASAGTYSATVTDANGCSVSLGNLLINECCNITIDANPFSPGCGKQLGFIDITVSGATDPITYIWSTGDTGEDIDQIGTGSYSVTVEDANGCSATGTWSINAGGVDIIIDAAVTQPICTNGFGSVTLTLTGGTAPFTIVWSNGSTGSILNDLTAGTYTVTVTDSFNCVASESITIINPSGTTLSSVVNNPGCSPGNDGSIDLIINGGLSPYSFIWNNGATTEDLSGLEVGIYSVTVTDANNCTTALSVNLELENDLTVEVADVLIACNDSIYELAALATGGTTPYVFIWSDGSSSESLQNPIIDQTYSVTVTDAAGCTATDGGLVSVQNLLTATTTLSDYGSGINVTCVNNNGSITLNVNNGAEPYTVIWSNGQTGLELIGLSSGTYTATITDAGGCTLTTTAELIKSDTLIISLTPSLYNGGFNISCNGASDGSIDINISAGVEPYTYIWSNGATSASLENISAGTYSVTVTDTNNCTGEASITLSEPNALTLNLNVTGNCNNSSTQTVVVSSSVEGGTTPYSYQWSNGTTGESFSPTTSGVYTLTVTDANGCQITDEIEVDVTEPLAITITQLNQLFCNSADTAQLQVIPNTGVGPYTIIWSTGDTSAIINNLAAGNYCVTVTDANNCSATACQQITVQNNLDVSIAIIQQPGCQNQFGVLQATASNGTAPYQYAWSIGGITGDLLNNVIPGTYSVTATDASGCTATTSITIPAVVPVIITSEIISQPTCETAANGSFTFIVTGGLPPYQITVNGNTVNSGDTIVTLLPGAYSIQVLDSSGCDAIIFVTLVPENNITATITILNQLTCLNGTDGAVNVSASGGTEPYTYLWTNGSTTQDAIGLSAGEYCVTITDVNGCSIVQCITLNNNLVLTTNTTTTDITCGNLCNGSASANPSGGIPPYSIQWANGSSSETINNLCQGTYYVTIIDANNCIVIDSAEIILPPFFTLQLTSTSDTIGCNATNGVEITSNVIGGSEPYSYIWSNGSTESSITVTEGGTYSVTVTDATQCIQNASITISEIPQIELIADVTDVTGCAGDSTGAISLTISNGTPGYAVLWSNGSTEESLNNLPAGVYTVTVSDAAGCSV
ncbi:MAG: hypothetical protein ACK5AS_01575, partial [Bacteroidota bacterium]